MERRQQLSGVTDTAGAVLTNGMLKAGNTAIFTVIATTMPASGTYATVRLSFFDGTVAEVKQTIP